jgi:hypothetical protein
LTIQWVHAYNSCCHAGTCKESCLADCRMAIFAAQLPHPLIPLLAHRQVTVPNVALSAEEAVEVQLEALRQNDSPWCDVHVLPLALSCGAAPVEVLLQ